LSRGADSGRGTAVVGARLVRAHHRRRPRLGGLAVPPLGGPAL